MPLPPAAGHAAGCSRGPGDSHSGPARIAIPVEEVKVQVVTAYDHCMQAREQVERSRSAHKPAVVSV